MFHYGLLIRTGPILSFVAPHFATTSYISSTVMTPPDWADVYHVYRRARYKVDYHLIELRRKYYSNSRNPRVIHSKLKRGILTTLRTCPNDKYLAKPGEYLSIEGAEPEPQSEPFDDLVDLYLEEPEEPLVDLEDTRSATDHENGPSAEIMSAETPATQFTPLSNDEFVLGSKSDLNLHFDKMAATPAKTESPAKYKPSMSDLQKVWSRLPFTQYKLQSIMKRNAAATATTESVEAYQITKCAQSEDRRVWKTVLNDVSLSAARLSTGSDVGSKDEFENLSGDFTDYKRKPVDVFADTLVRGRAKFHGRA